MRSDQSAVDRADVKNADARAEIGTCLVPAKEARCFKPAQAEARCELLFQFFPARIRPAQVRLGDYDAAFARQLRQADELRIITKEPVTDVPPLQVLERSGRQHQ